MITLIELSKLSGYTIDQLLYEKSWEFVLLLSDCYLKVKINDLYWRNAGFNLSKEVINKLESFDSDSLNKKLTLADVKNQFKMFQGIKINRHKGK